MTSQIPLWFEQARIGMFYHFGLYTLLGGNENNVRSTTGKADYRKMLGEFKAEHFNADDWIDCALSMGARYIVPTAKHAEGFCLWDSKWTDHKSTRTPFGRDLIGELAEAAAKKGIQFCFYFNLETWLNEGDDIWNRQGMSYPEFFEAQLTELLTQYGPVGLIWFDHVHPEIPPDRWQKVIALIKRLQPDCLVNDRGVHRNVPMMGDYITPERQIPDSTEANKRFIECCDSMGVKSWGFHSGEVFWSTSELAKRVSLCRSKGYNYLLNVEPALDGSIRPECVIRARGLGDWVEKNRLAVDAGPCDFLPIDPNISHEPPLGVATLGGNTLYLHLHQWPVADEIFVKAEGQPLSAGIEGESLTATVEEKGIRVGGLPAEPPAGNGPWIVAVEFKDVPTAPAAAPAKILEIMAGESLHLSPLDAALNSVNGVIIPAINRFANGNISVGSLHKVDDTLTWRALSPGEGEFEVYASLGSIQCQENAGFELSCGSSVIRGRTWLTAHYSQPVSKPIGRLRLAKGENLITLRVTDTPMDAFSDVHGITLIPN